MKKEIDRDTACVPKMPRTLEGECEIGTERRRNEEKRSRSREKMNERMRKRYVEKDGKKMRKNYVEKVKSVCE